MAESTKRILVVDDEPKIVDVVQSYLEANGYQVRSAGSGRQAMELVGSFKPALIVLDLMLPDMRGEDICKAIRQESTVPIIMLTAKVAEENVLAGLGLGADDYVTKPFSPRLLVARVEAILRRAHPDDAKPASSFNHGELVIDTATHEVMKHGAAVNLTPNEFMILSTLAKYPKKAFTREEIIALVIGSDYDGYDRVIDTHIKNIRQKIEQDPKSPQLILTVHGLGYRFGGEKDET